MAKMWPGPPFVLHSRTVRDNANKVRLGDWDEALQFSLADNVSKAVDAVSRDMSLNEQRKKMEQACYKLF
eukprot:6175135-Pleurochrysis_carterae.AAC.2